MATRKKTTTGKKPQYVRAKKRKGNDSSVIARRSVSIVLLLLVIGAFFYGIAQGFKWIGRGLYSENPRFEIQHLVVSSDGNLTEDYLRSASGLSEGVNLWDFTFEEIEEKLLGVSMVESVYLERKLPHTLIVRVKERVRVARVRIPRISSRIDYTLDRYGYVLPPRSKAASLPLISGIDPDVRPGERITHPDIDIALKIIGLCESTGYLRTYVRVESLDLRYPDFIDMRLEGGIRALMPRSSLKLKLQNLATIIKIETGKGLRVKEANLTLDSPKVPVTYY